MVSRFVRPTVVALAGLMLFGAGHSAVADDDAGGEVGMLTCESVPGTRINLVVHSRVDIECEFKDSDGSAEQYVGKTGVAVGVDLHLFHNETLRFAVLARHFEPGTHQLAGSYGGAKAGVTAGVGGGAALLVGGSDNTIGLKPAVTHGTGVGATAGVGFLLLEPKEL